VQRSGLFDRIHRPILKCPKVHLRDDYERQAGFWEGHDSYEFTYDWLPPLASRKIRFSRGLRGMQRYVCGMRRQFAANRSLTVLN
jgi:hypothetical protein